VREVTVGPSSDRIDGVVVTLKVPGPRFRRDRRFAFVEKLHPAFAIQSLCTDVHAQSKCYTMPVEVVIQPITVIITKMRYVPYGSDANVDDPTFIGHQGFKHGGIESVRNGYHAAARPIAEQEFPRIERQLGGDEVRLDRGEDLTFGTNGRAWQVNFVANET